MHIERSIKAKCRPKEHLSVIYQKFVFVQKGSKINTLDLTEQTVTKYTLLRGHNYVNHVGLHIFEE